MNGGGYGVARLEGIVRAPRKGKFEILPLCLIRDSGLSYRGLGVLVRLLSNEDNFRMTSCDLARERKEGRDAVRAALRGIEDAGYLVRERRQNSRGQWVTEMVVYDTPQVPRLAENADFQSSVNQASDIQSSENQALKAVIPIRNTTTTTISDLVAPQSLNAEDGCEAVRMVRTISDQIAAQKVLYELDAAISANRISGSWRSYLYGLIKNQKSGDFVFTAGKKPAAQRQPEKPLREKLGLPPVEKISKPEKAREALRIIQKSLRSRRK